MNLEPKSIGWIYLICASVMEIAWVMGLKSTNGLTRFWPSVYVLLVGLASVMLLAQATKHLPTGTAYAVWTGLGTAGTVGLGIILFSESRDTMRLLCIALIIIGVVGLKFFPTQ